MAEPAEPEETDAERRARGLLTPAQHRRLLVATGAQMLAAHELAGAGEVPGLRETRDNWIEQQVQIGGMNRAEATRHAGEQTARSDRAHRAGERPPAKPAKGWR